MTREEMMAKLQNSFMAKAVSTMANLQNWPKADVPCGAQVNELIPELCKLPFDYLFRDDAVSMAECSLLVQEYLDLDILGINLDVYNFEAESMGAKIHFYKDHAPDIDRRDYLIKDESDFDKIKWNGLNSGRFPFLQEYYRAYMSYVGIVPPIFTMCSPWSLASNLYGMENLICMTVEDPEFVEEFLDRLINNVYGPMLQDLNEAIPEFVEISLADAFASPPMCNMDTISRFIAPLPEKIEKACGIPDFKVVLGGIWGTSYLTTDCEKEKFNEILVKTGGILSGYDPDAERLSPEYYRKEADRLLATLFLGLSASYLETKSPMEVVERVKEYVLKGKAGITPMAIMINNIAPNAPLGNVFHAVQALRIYGAPGADENTPFIEPEVPSFENFLKEKLDNNREGYTFRWLEKSEYSYLK